MVAYFKKQTWLFMLGGLALALLVTAACWNTTLVNETLFVKLAFLLMLGLVGVVAGRMLATRWANRRLARLSAILYAQCDPAAFLKAFEPIAERTPRDNVAFADAQTKIAFARTALGEFDRALAALDRVKPGDMKLHSLHARALTLNQRTRTLLAQEDAQGAAEALRQMEALETDARARAKMLAEQLGACNRLAREWLAFLQGSQADPAYLREEAELAKNDLYRAEMELLLGRVLEQRGERDEAARAYRSAVQHGHDLCVARQAEARLAALAD